MIEPGNTNPVLISCGKEFDRGIADFVESNAYNKVRAGRTVAASFGLSTRTTWIVNVLRFGDLNHDPSLRGHVGCHPEILKGFFATTDAAHLGGDKGQCWHGGLLQQEPSPLRWSELDACFGVWSDHRG